MPRKEMQMKFRTEVGCYLGITTLMILLFTFQVAGEEKKGEVGPSLGGTPLMQSKWTTKVVPVKYADVEALAAIIRPFRMDMGYVSFNREIKVLTISGDAEILSMMEETIKRFDVPPPSTKNVEITAYLLVGEETATGAKIPSDLEGVIKQLKNVFPYSTFRLLDTLVVRCRDGKGGKVNGIAPSKSSESQRTLYNLDFDTVRLMVKGTQNLIRIDRLRLGARLPIEFGTPPQFQYLDTGISTDIDVLEGQKIVVGKSTVDGSNNAIFLSFPPKSWIKFLVRAGAVTCGSLIRESYDHSFRRPSNSGRLSLSFLSPFRNSVFESRPLARMAHT
jgi:hypothetical protein